MMDKSKAFMLDSLAIQLAAEAGQLWIELGDFPGYARNIWREEARSRVLKDLPDAVFELLPAEHDWQEERYLVKPLS